MNKKPRVVIAGLRGGSGKTTLSLGLTAQLVARGLSVAPFKKGPDYIDAGWMSKAAKRECYNLDPFLFGDKIMFQSFIEHSEGFDCSVIEGNRGLFDGMDAEGSNSTSNLARLLNAPVIVIADCTKATRTMAAVMYGVKRFERGLKLGGVVLNMVAGKRHQRVLTESIEQHAGVRVLGAIPRIQSAVMPERHMGLTPIQEHRAVRGAIKKAAEIVGEYVDIDAIWEIMGTSANLKGPSADTSVSQKGTTRRLKVPKALDKLPTKPSRNKVSVPVAGINNVTGLVGGVARIGVIVDSAFQFYYPDNLEALEAQGAEVIRISALKAKALPDDLDALYIGGGFPETHAVQLSKNLAFKRSVKRAADAGLPIYAECGGLMYLGRTIKLQGKKYKMSGVLPVDFTLHPKPRAHGYTIVRVARKNPFYKVGTELRGHEFHYSQAELGSDEPLVLKMKRGTGIINKTDGIVSGNVFATYTHVHALGSPEWAEGMMRAATAYQQTKTQ